MTNLKKPAGNSTFALDEVSCSADSLLVGECSVLAPTFVTKIATFL